MSKLKSGAAAALRLTGAAGGMQLWQVWCEAESA